MFYALQYSGGLFSEEICWIARVLCIFVETCRAHAKLFALFLAAVRWLEFLEGPRFESSRQNLPEMATFLKRYFYDTANASASVIR